MPAPAIGMSHLPGSAEEAIAPASVVTILPRRSRSHVDAIAALGVEPSTAVSVNAPIVSRGRPSETTTSPAANGYLLIRRRAVRFGRRPGPRSAADFAERGSRLDDASPDDGPGEHQLINAKNSRNATPRPTATTLCDTSSNTLRRARDWANPVVCCCAAGRDRAGRASSPPREREMMPQNSKSDRPSARGRLACGEPRVAARAQLEPCAAIQADLAAQTGISRFE
jgi:hypothetical protein